jgi:hypothetical protein
MGGFATNAGFGYGSAMARGTQPMIRKWILAAGIAGLAAGLAVATRSGEAQPGAAAMRCTNPASGASWQIVIDYGKNTVDANPAEISRTAISWFDPRDGGRYRLDRGSGDLTGSAASSTGGYFRYARCRPEQSP